MTITREQYWQLTGLLTLAKMRMSELEAIEKAIQQITQEQEGGSGHTGDAIFSGYSADELLGKLNITVLAESESEEQADTRL